MILSFLFPLAEERAHREVGGEEHEDEEREDLPRQTSQHDVVSYRRIFPFPFCNRCISAAGSLQDEGEYVARDEDLRIPMRWDARAPGADGKHDVFQAEVDSSSQEGWGDGQADDLSEERTLIVVNFC